MTVVISIAILILLVLGIVNRRRQQSRWVAEERYEESGRWIDKRPGERGTFGTLDEEREAQRRTIARESRARELADLIRNYAFETIPAFKDQPDEAIQNFSRFTRKITGQILTAAGLLLEGQAPLASEKFIPDEFTLATKKIILNYIFQVFPKLVDVDLELLKRFDDWVGFVASDIKKVIDDFL